MMSLLLCCSNIWKGTSGEGRVHTNKWGLCPEMHLSGVTMSFVAYHKEAFIRVGWFIPAYASMGFLGQIAKAIHERGKAFTQDDLEIFLAQLYSPLALAAMVTTRYPETPFVQDYRAIIAEAVEVHCMGLHHVAVAGLLPVVEGAARKLAASRGLRTKRTDQTFLALILDCKKEVETKRIGLVEEVLPMLECFAEFANENLYTHSDRFWLPDKTNRNGILHGAYADADYGRPINFYKTISAVDVLCFISAIRAHVSWLAPSVTPEAQALAKYYLECRTLGEGRLAMKGSMTGSPSA